MYVHDGSTEELGRVLSTSGVFIQQHLSKHYGAILVSLRVTMSDTFEWDRLEDRVLVGPEVIQEMEDQMQTIRQRIKEVQDQ